MNPTTNSETNVETLRKVKPGGAAVLSDVNYAACTSRKLVVGKPVEPRRILVVIGHGDDKKSRNCNAPP